MLFCHMTSRVEGDAYPKLLSEKGGTGFPYLVWMDAAGEVIAKQGDRSVPGFQKTREAITAFQTLEKKAKAGDKTVGADLLSARIDMGQVKFEDAKKAASQLGSISADKRKKLDAQLLDLEVQDMLAGVRSQQEMNEVGKKFIAMMNDGRVPAGMNARRFYSAILGAAEADKDVKTFEKAFKGLKDAVGDDQRAAKNLEQLQQKLDKLKADAK